MNGNIQIAPSMLSADFGRLSEEVRALEAAGADMLHIDVMDGMFVPNITFGACVIRALRSATRLPLDVHMMVESPERYIDDMADAGADIITVHVEATRHIHRAIQKITERAGVIPGIALNPGTPCSAVECVLGAVGLVLVMTVNPGFGGQRLILPALDKIAAIRGMLQSIGSHAMLEVDGGVMPDNAGQFVSRGANVLVSGTGVFSAEDRAEAISRMRKGKF